MRRNGVLLLFPLLVVCAYAAPARGGLVTWEFGGTIQSVLDPNDVLGGALANGSPFSGSFTFDPTTPGTAADAGGKSSFDNPLLDLSGLLGTFGFSGPLFGNSTLDITDGALGSDDIFGLSSSVLLNGEALNFLLTLTDSSGTVFSNGALPEHPPDLSAFDSATMQLLRQTNDLTIHGTLTYLVPEPSTLCLLAMGVVAIVGKRRRR